jgi:L-ascorbate metabolism protein UlaG (beta-lactamase superfamily)
VAEGEIAVTFIGQATFLLRTAAGTILTDPFFSERASPFASIGPRRLRAPGFALDALPDIDLILLSHNHYDHMDLPSLRALRARTTAPILTGLGNGAYLARKGVSGAVEMDWWQRTTPRPDVAVSYVPAQHWSSRSPRDRRRMLWGGFVVRSGGATIYFAGDTGYCPWFGTIRERLGAPDLALLPIGAYEPRWFMQNQHMNPAEAVQAHLDLGSRHSIGMHFGTIQLTDEAVDEPLHALARAAREAGLGEGAFTTLDFGESRIIRAG